MLNKNKNAQCPVCREPVGQYSHAVGSYEIVKCARCGLEHTLPVPSDVTISDYYQNYFDFKAPLDVACKNASKNLEILRQFGFSRHSLVLDFGAGDGGFVKTIGKNCYGIDFRKSTEPRMFQHMDALPVAKFDFITLWDVLEHLTRPVETIRMLAEMLRPGGKIVVMTVDAEGAIPYYYKPIEHLTYWTKKSLQHLFDRCGFEILYEEPYWMHQRSEIYLNRLLSRTPSAYRAAFTAALAELPDYVEVPTNEILVVATRRTD